MSILYFCKSSAKKPSTSSFVGSDGCAPIRVTLTAAAAMAIFIAS